MTYLAAQVADVLADWVDAAEPRKGIIARELLPSGKVISVQAPARSAAWDLRMPPVEPDGNRTRFVLAGTSLADRMERANLARQASVVNYFGISKELIPLDV